MEIDDEGIDKEISKIILRTEEKINEFKQHIDKTSFTLSNDDLTSLRKLMIETKNKIIHLQNDIATITQLKLENQQFFIIKDENFFSDKKRQLEQMSELVHGFIEIIEQHPSTQELRDELLGSLINDLMKMQSTMNKILTDDRQLRDIYKRLNQV